MATAPDFGENYPSGGQLIGPAWQAAWDFLEHGDWVDRTTVVEAMTKASPIKPKTAANLLRWAAKKGLLDVHYPSKWKVRVRRIVPHEGQE